MRPAVPRNAQPSQAGLALKYAAAAAVICGVVIGSLFLYENLTQFRAGSAPAGSQPVVSPLAAVAPMPAIGLRAVRQNGDLLLTWNRDAALVARATSALLVIQDGRSERQIPLNATQVQSGSVLYSPVSEQIQMQLTVTGPASSVAESVLVILPKSGPPQVKLQATKRTPEPPANTTSAPEESAPVRALKPFTAPAPTTRAPQTAAIDEVPALATGLNSSAPAHLPLAASAPQVVRPQTPPPPAAEPAAAPPAPPLVRSEYHAPEVVSKVVPQFPQALRALVVKPKTVQVRVSIDDKGKITKVEPLRQPDIHGMLIEEAVRAARGWKFLPARQGSQGVPSEMVLYFAFNTNIFKEGSQK
jgi:TonB family protein